MILEHTKRTVIILLGNSLFSAKVYSKDMFLLNPNHRSGSKIIWIAQVVDVIVLILPRRNGFRLSGLFTGSLHDSVNEQYNVLKSAIHGKQGLETSSATISLSQPWQ